VLLEEMRRSNAEQGAGMADRAMVFVDGHNFNESARQAGMDPDVDLFQLGLKLARPQRAELLWVYVYRGKLGEGAGSDAEREKEEKDFARIHSMPQVILRLGRVIVGKGPRREKGEGSRCAVGHRHAAARRSWAL